MELLNQRLFDVLGRHWLIELWHCPVDRLADPDRVERVLRRAAKKAGVKVVNGFFQRFSPYGVSGFLVITESHFAVHTWPEYGYAAIDLFTCGDHRKLKVAYRELVKGFSSKQPVYKVLLRGNKKIVESRPRRLRSKRRSDQSITSYGPTNTQAPWEIQRGVRFR